MEHDDERSAATTATEVLKPQVRQLLEVPYSPEQIVVAFLTVAYDLFRTDAADRSHLEPVEAFHKLARSTAREFEKLRQPPSPARAKPAKR